ncbi:MAG: hypothetical protein ACLTKI_06720 [Lachnospiraceae bacterium]
MKKRVYVAAAALAVALMAAGCSSKETAAPAETTTASQEVSASEETEGNAEGGAAAETEAEETEAATEAVVHQGYVFQSGDVIMGMNENVAAALEGLGEYSNYAESTSCAFQGLDKIYTYAGFDIYTYPVEDQDFINSIYFTDETVSTPEGIHIGSTLEEMTAAYGEDYSEEFGVYTYTKDDSTLSFIVTDGVIESVEYTAIVEE